MKGFNEVKKMNNLYYTSRSRYGLIKSEKKFRGAARDEAYIPASQTPGN